MIEAVRFNTEINQKQEIVFNRFINEIDAWWPREYTWSQANLVSLRMATHVGGFCTEYGPHDFRIDWGTIEEIEMHKLIAFRWQISPDRVPIPDKSCASLVHIAFNATTNNGTAVSLSHEEFDKHESGAENYREMMASENGWPFLMQTFQTYCDNNR